MKKTCITRKCSEVPSDTLHEEGILVSATVVSLEESSQELKKKEARKPLYLIRYE